MTYLLKWNKFINATDVPKVAGIYLYTLNDFENIPFYIGTAGERTDSSLFTRINSSKKLFTTGKRTFLRDSFFSELTKFEFSERWREATPWNKFIYVPDTICDFGTHEKIESTIFWEKRITKYYARLPDLQGHRGSLRAIEAKLQNSVRLKYPNVTLKIPNVNFQYLGQTNQSDLERAKNIVIKSEGYTLFDA